MKSGQKQRCDSSLLAFGLSVGQRVGLLEKYSPESFILGGVLMLCLIRTPCDDYFFSVYLNNV